MARYVLLAFRDNEQADMFAKMFDKSNFLDEDQPPAEVVGIFFQPTQFCECEQGTTTSRGKRYGLEVHKCGKPIKGRWQHPKNLVKEDGTLYEQGLYLGIVEPQDGEMPNIDFLQRGKALGVTRRG